VLPMTIVKQLAKHPGIVGWAKRSVPTIKRNVTGFVGTALRAFAHPTAPRLVASAFAKGRGGQAATLAMTMGERLAYRSGIVG